MRDARGNAELVLIAVALITITSTILEDLASLVSHDCRPKSQSRAGDGFVCALVCGVKGLGQHALQYLTPASNCK